jgi:hypothetical protein
VVPALTSAGRDVRHGRQPLSLQLGRDRTHSNATQTNRLCALYALTGH